MQDLTTMITLISLSSFLVIYLSNQRLRQYSVAWVEQTVSNYHELNNELHELYTCPSIGELAMQLTAEENNS